MISATACMCDRRKIAGHCSHHSHTFCSRNDGHRRKLCRYPGFSADMDARGSEDAAESS